MRVADLHLHTIFSDGTYTPAELVQEAAKQGLAAIAVADHDTLDGIAPVSEIASSKKIEVLPADVENVINKMAPTSKITLEQAKQVMARSGKVDDIKDSLLEEKALDLLVGRAKKKTEKK